MGGAEACTCRRYLDDGRPNRNPDGSVKEVTVACDVHHLMADGEPASLHEVLCTCGNFADDRDCTVYMDQGGEPERVCNSEGCASVLVEECGFRLPTDAERAEWRLPAPAALRDGGAE